MIDILFLLSHIDVVRWVWSVSVCSLFCLGLLEYDGLEAGPAGWGRQALVSCCSSKCGSTIHYEQLCCLGWKCWKYVVPVTACNAMPVAPDSEVTVLSLLVSLWGDEATVFWRITSDALEATE